MTTEYRIYDRRNGQYLGKSVQPDCSAKSENAAIREVGADAIHAEVETRKLSDDASRPHVGN